MEAAIRQTKTSTVIGGFILWVALLVIASFGLHWYGTLMHLDVQSPIMFFYSRLVFWAIVGILYLYAVRVEWQPMLLWPDHKYKFGYVVLSTLATLGVIYGALIVVGLLLKLLGLTAQSKLIEHIMLFSKPLRLFAAVTAAVTEELIFRGYLMPRLQLFFKTPIWPITITTLLFGLGHARYGTVINVVGPLVIGLVFALHYNKYRNIKILMLCHFIIDFIGLMIWAK